MYFEIAGLKVSMNPKYQPLKAQAIPYQVVLDEGTPLDCEIPQGEEAIKRYMKKHPEFSKGIAEYMLYGAYFYDALLALQGILLHASCVVHEEHAYLFSAPCGTGKSTHTAIWNKVFPASYILNDDKPAIRYKNDVLYAYGTPFSGKTNKNKNTSAPIAGIAFVKRGVQNSVRVLNSKEVFILFMGQTLKPHHEKRLDQMTAIIETVIAKIPIYELTCNMDDEAALVSFHAMKPKNGTVLI